MAIGTLRTCRRSFPVRPYPPRNRCRRAGNQADGSVRTRWVDYKDYELDPYDPSIPFYTPANNTYHSAHVEPGWHAWLSYMVDQPPTVDPILKNKVRSWELPEHRPNPTQSRGAYKPYSTYANIFTTIRVLANRNLGSNQSSLLGHQKFRPEYR